MTTLVILFSVILNLVFTSAQGQSTSAVQNVGIQYVNGFPDQIALEQTQQQQQQQFLVNPNSQHQSFIVDGNYLQPQHVQTVQGILGQAINSLGYAQQNLQPLVYQQSSQNLVQNQPQFPNLPNNSQNLAQNSQNSQNVAQNPLSLPQQPQYLSQQPQNLVQHPQYLSQQLQYVPQQQFSQIQTPKGNQFVNYQLPQGTQIVQNSPVPVIQQQAGLQYLPVAPPQAHQYIPQGHLSHFVSPIPHALHFPVENPSFVASPIPVSPVFHHKHTVIQQPVPVPVNPVVTVKEVVKVPVPVPVAVKFQPICTVYPFQRNIPGCVLEKALFPGKYHPDVVVPSPTKKTEADKVQTSTKTTATPPRAVAAARPAKPEAKIAPAKKNSSRKKNPVNDMFVVLNNNSESDEDIPSSTANDSPNLNFDDEDEKLLQELEKQAQNEKEQ